MFRQAADHHRSGRLSEAEAGYRNILTANPRHTGALSHLGLLAHQSGHSDAGIDLLKKAIASDRRNAELHYNLACIFADCRRDDDALAHNRKALDLRPGYPEASNNLAALLLLRGEGPEALKIAVRGLQSNATESLKATFVMIVRALNPAQIPADRTVMRFLARALQEPWCRPRDISHTAGTLLLRSAEFTRFAAQLAHPKVL